jgi:hypothetical protein
MGENFNSKSKKLLETIGKNLETGGVQAITGRLSARPLRLPWPVISR